MLLSDLACEMAREKARCAAPLLWPMVGSTDTTAARAAVAASGGCCARTSAISSSVLPCVPRLRPPSPGPVPSLRRLPRAKVGLGLSCPLPPSTPPPTPPPRMPPATEPPPEALPAAPGPAGAPPAGPSAPPPAPDEGCTRVLPAAVHLNTACMKRVAPPEDSAADPRPDLLPCSPPPVPPSPGSGSWAPAHGSPPRPLPPPPLAPSPANLKDTPPRAEEDARLAPPPCCCCCCGSMPLLPACASPAAPPPTGREPEELWRWSGSAPAAEGPLVEPKGSVLFPKNSDSGSGVGTR